MRQRRLSLRIIACGGYKLVSFVCVLNTHHQVVLVPTGEQTLSVYMDTTHFEWLTFILVCRLCTLRIFERIPLLRGAFSPRKQCESGCNFELSCIPL